MNKALKNILRAGAIIGKELADEFPGGGLVVSGIEALVDKDNKGNIKAVSDIGTGVVLALNAIKNDEVVNAQLFTAGINELEDALMKIKMSLKS
tara:strand:- start:9141 stop:9422 length:282 start_codon:yes stop_codon:yes gene_type:complete